MDKDNTINIFIAYSEKDQEFLNLLEGHFSVLRDPTLNLWWKGLVEFGTEKDEVIQEQINTADIILLLISSDFFKSDYIHKLELKKALEKHQAGSARVIPVILRSCGWTLNKDISKLKPLPGDGKPVDMWRTKDEAFTNVVINVQNTVMKIRERFNIQLEPSQQQEVTPQIEEKPKEVWEESEPHDEQITYQEKQEENKTVYAMPGEWQPFIPPVTTTPDPVPEDDNNALENRDEQNFEENRDEAVVKNTVELKMALQQIADQYGYEFKEYMPNKFWIKVAFNMPDGSQRFQTVYTWISDIGRNKKPCIYMQTRVGIYNDSINLYNVAKDAGSGIYSAITILNDKDMANNPCESLIVQAAPNLEHTDFELFKDILTEVAYHGDLLEEKYFGKDIN